MGVEAMAAQLIEATVDPQDIARRAVFLTSDAAKAVSGREIPIDNDREKLTRPLKAAARPDV
jgi:enoyl-[acyl-carrier-protein] reductase (NADH)